MDYLRMIIWLAIVGAIVLYGAKLVSRAGAKTGV